MELSEESKYRLSYLTAPAGVRPHPVGNADPGREARDARVPRHPRRDAASPARPTGKRYASQREKIESFIDAEFDEDLLALINRTIDELA